jgi:ribosomal protein S18 acetylase RimI-like enzyme
MDEKQVLNEINAELERVGIRLIPKPWESDLLGYRVFSLSWQEHDEKYEEIWSEAIERAIRRLEAPCMLSARVPAGAGAVVRALERCGFCLMECYLELEHQLHAPPSRRSRTSTVRPSRESDIGTLRKIAEESFQFSRFHMDPRIELKVAALTRAEWVENACRGRADVVLVSETDGKATGFLCVRSKEGDRGMIGCLDLIAVDPSQQGRGIGNDLVVEFLDFCRHQKYSVAEVGTQAHNIASLRLYEATGFKMLRASYSYHLHVD